jgi:hypothetical protein
MHERCGERIRLKPQMAAVPGIDINDINSIHRSRRHTY